MIERFLGALDDDKEYDFIANWYPYISKDEFKDILLEYIYAVHEQGKVVEEEIRDSVREELEDKICKL